ncbi:class I SAM-dependent DNA methyltransferase [Rufibacter sp. LB8]|uniref:HsdM family class I SAM-dependent methyltransferase n=1 Tax=Rufibacter sp. LB8 TaxID=2777781 RepID=UPI00178C4053|nr:N-6 DNA methylase [Rufibacter sp. LB8]
MEALFDTYNILTSKVQNGISLSIDQIGKFASELGWNPSYFEKPTLEDFANGHIIVEHGLENTAVLSFLNIEFEELSTIQQRLLINISYNNLVDWHIVVDRNYINYIYNRSLPGASVISRNKLDSKFNDLRSEAFDKVRGKKPSPNLPPLDDALIDTISYWKRNLASLTNYSVTNGEISSLFNTIFFIRALEDTKKRYDKDSIGDKILMDEFNLLTLSQPDNFNITYLLKHVIKKLDYGEVPEDIVNFDTLKVFNELPKRDVQFLIRDFYINKVADLYTYDFSIMSKHAFSRIYERYVSILKIEETPQTSLWPVVAEELNKATGTVYTPQYIARFFAKYLQSQLPVSKFLNLKTLEPAIGSGIFIRTLLELQWEAFDGQLEENIYRNNFENLLGLDIDENACQATRLSISLLHLLAFNKFPSKLNILNKESVDYFMTSNHNNEFDVIISNPPFVQFNSLDEENKNKLKNYLGPLYRGKPDLYFAFLKLAIEALKPGGYAAFVLPHSFLVTDGAKLLRKYLAENVIIKFWADLSSIGVFGNTGVYVTLLIFQKKHPHSSRETNNVTILKCNRNVGKALEDVLNCNFVEQKNYSIYQVEQDIFQRDQWFVLSKFEYSLNKRLETFRKLDEFLDIKQGFNSGGDEVFIRDVVDIPANELSIYIPHVRDREMETYTLPEVITKYFFYPFVNGQKVDQEYIMKNFPATWDYLLSKRAILSKTKKKRRIGGFHPELETQKICFSLKLLGHILQ